MNLKWIIIRNKMTDKDERLLKTTEECFSPFQTNNWKA